MLAWCAYLAFLLCCHLLVGEGKLEQKTLEQLVVFLLFLKSKSKDDEDIVEKEKGGSTGEGEAKGKENQENNESTEKKSQGVVMRPKPEQLPWLKESSWKYFIHFEEEFEELQGIRSDISYLAR